MIMRIHQLPAAVANQIAAGEVIERPASVVKELLENSLDAGADSIVIDIGYGGLNHIKISDNGVGILAEDLPLAIAAHATSKIKVLNDLYAIRSMGFRGEALASIASVAKVIICSKPEHQEYAAELRTTGDTYNVIPSARAVGTTIEVVDIFYNAPVRKRFLKGEKIEFQAIESLVKRFAMSAPHIAITLKHNGKPSLTLPAAKNEAAQWTRLSKLFGTAFAKDSIHVDVERGGMRLYGWISNLNFQRSQNDKQWVYINQRMVKDKLILQALKQAYEGLLHPGRFPACLLYLTINTHEVDVNVHPTKHEVRFQHPRLVHDLLTSQIAQALKATRVPQEIEYLVPTASTISYDLAEPYTPPLFTSQESLPGFDNWVILNSNFSLVFHQKKPYLIDVIASYCAWIGFELQQQPEPWRSRPLLVPVSIVVPPYWQNALSELEPKLNRLGIEIDSTTPQRLTIKTLPIQLPYFDLHAFFAAIFVREAIDFSQLKHLLSSSNLLDAASLSSEERTELLQWCLNQKPSALFRELTLDDCRMILHA